LAYELATGDYLFNPTYSDDNDRDIEHLNLFTKYLGELPRYFQRRGKYANSYYRNNRLIRVNVGRESSIYELLTYKKKWPSQIADLFANFLEMLLNLDPAKRPSAIRCLDHPFMTDVHNFSAMHHLYLRKEWSDVEDEEDSYMSG